MMINVLARMSKFDPCLDLNSVALRKTSSSGGLRGGARVSRGCDHGYYGVGGGFNTPEKACEQLLSALREHEAWEGRAKSSKDFLLEMLSSRKEAANLVEDGLDLW